MASFHKKPFYFQHPWIVLFELHKLHKLRPWGVNISFLLESFLEEMNKQREVDFRASGVALNSSATIYLLKSGLLLKLEDPPTPPKPQPDFIPPPLSYPLRYELTSTTIKHLLRALDDALKGERLLTLRPRSTPILPPPPKALSQINLYLIEIEKEMERLYSSLLRLADEGKPIIFSEVIAGLEEMEAVKSFIILLFLAQNGKVDLWEEDELGEIYITLIEGRPIAEERAEIA